MMWCLSPGVRWMLVEDGAVVFAPSTGSFADLNEPATELWLVLSKAEWSEDAAVRHLIDQHALTESDAQHTVGRFIARLQDTNLLIPRAG